MKNQTKMKKQTKKNSNTHSKTRNLTHMKGGVIINKSYHSHHPYHPHHPHHPHHLNISESQAFLEFLKLSKCEMFTESGAFSIILKADILLVNREEYNRNPIYIDNRPSKLKSPHQPVHSILIKLVQISTEKPNPKSNPKPNPKSNLRHNNNNHDQIPVLQSEFFNEISTQQEIYYKSLQDPKSFGEPICPSIVYGGQEEKDSEISAQIIECLNRSDGVLQCLRHKGFSFSGMYNATQEFMKKFACIPESIKKIFKPINDYPAIFSLGILAMENMEDYIPLLNLINDFNTSTSKSKLIAKRSFLFECYTKATYLLLRLYIEYNLEHVDAHSNNILVNTNNGNVIIIDFGQIEKSQLRNFNWTYKDINEIIRWFKFISIGKIPFNEISNKILTELHQYSILKLNNNFTKQKRPNNNNNPTNSTNSTNPKKK